MENVVLVIHLLLALTLIGVVLMQRSEGGGLGIGGGGGGGLVSARGAATALGKLTWLLAIGFIITSVSLTLIAANAQDGASVVDNLGGVPIDGGTDGAIDGELLLPPSIDGGAEETPLVPDAN